MNGLIIQWGESAVSTDGYLDITFNISFTSVGYVNAVSRADSYDNYYRHQMLSLGTTTARIRDTNASYNTKFKWFAIGY